MSTRFALVVPFLVGLAPVAGLGTEMVDIELVLAIDLSGSVDGAEQDLQRKGLAAAFRDAEVVAAIAGLPQGVAVALVGWAGAGQERTLLGWRRLNGQSSAEAFAIRIEAMPPVTFGRGKTAIGDALTWSLAELAGNGFEGRARIDVSGDGHNTDGAYPHTIRDVAVATGVTISGLAIVNEEPYLADYYQSNVIGGPGAFVMTAGDYTSFAEAIRRKLLRELQPPPIAMR